MKISVVIPLYNSAKTIKQTLISLFAQTVKPDEIILVYSPSKDNTKEIIETFDNIKIVEAEKLSAAYSRNIGFKLAANDIVAFTDSDCVLPVDWIKNIKEIFNEKNIDALTGPVVGVNSGTVFEKYLDLFGLNIVQEDQLFEKYEYLKSFGHTANLIVKKSVLLKLDGFNSKLNYAEDHDFCARLFNSGFNLYFSNLIKINHIFVCDFSKFLKLSFNYNKAHCYLAKNYYNKIVILINNKIKFEKHFKFPVILRPVSLTKKVLLLLLLSLFQPLFLIVLFLYFIKIKVKFKLKYPDQDAIMLTLLYFLDNLVSEFGEFSGNFKYKTLFF